MKEALVPRITGEVNWQEIPCISIDEKLKPDSANVTAQAQICYDDTALYLRLSAKEREIRAEENGLTGMPCLDSCLEFFFSPKEGDLRYFNMEYNPNACLYLGYGPSIEELTRLIQETKEEMDNIFHPQVTMHEDGWEITYQVPYSFVRRFCPEFAPAPGKTMRANFYKCASLVANPHFMAWNPIKRIGRSRFHTPAEFGLLRFE